MVPSPPMTTRVRILFFFCWSVLWWTTTNAATPVPIPTPTQAPHNNTPVQFTLLVAANAQFVSYDNVLPPNLHEADEIRRNALRQIRQQYADMNALAGGHHNHTTHAEVWGAILMGDLTATGHPAERTVVQQEMAELAVQIYPGLGPLDYASSVDALEKFDVTSSVERRRLRSTTTTTTTTTKLTDDRHQHDQIQMIQFMYRWLQENAQPNNGYGQTTIDPDYDMFHRHYYLFPSERVDYYGSLSYSFDLGGRTDDDTAASRDTPLQVPTVHVIQLHNYPTFARDFEAWDPHLHHRDFAFIRSSLDWLERDLALARNRGDIILVVMHDPFLGGHHNISTTNPALDYVQKLFLHYNVSAVIAGHGPAHCGLLPQGTTGWDPIPVFTAGSASYQHYLVLDFMLAPRQSLLQVRTRQDTTLQGHYHYPSHQAWNISLLAPRPNPPLPVPGRAGTVTFFCDGGFVATGQVSYTRTTTGSRESESTHNLALGNQYVIFLPSDAIEVRIQGHYIAAGLHKIVDLTLDAGVHDDICIRLYGTLFKRGWDRSCGRSGSSGDHRDNGGEGFISTY